MDMTASERIKELLKYKGLNVKTLSEAIGYERPQALYDLINGKTRSISPAMSERILKAMPEINRIWLIAGEGNMLAGEATEPDIRVPCVSITAIAGPLDSYYESGEDLEWCRRVISPVPGADIAIEVSGDSMEPVFQDGMKLYIKRINEAAFIPWGTALVIDTENGVFIKRVMPDTNDETYIWAESTNSRYPAMHIPKTSVRGMYRVLGYSKSFVAQ